MANIWDFVQKQVYYAALFDGHSLQSIVILDNASIHHVDTVVSAILSAGALLKFSPPYSPDLNPTEREVKHYLQANTMILPKFTFHRNYILYIMSTGVTGR